MLHSISTLRLTAARGMVTDTTKIRWEVAYVCAFIEGLKSELHLSVYIVHVCFEITSPYLYCLQRGKRHMARF